MKVYGYPKSTCTRKVLMTLFEKSVPFKFEQVNLAKAEQKAPDYIKRHHPFGVIPVLDDDGFQLYESRAIMRYLDKRVPGTSLSFSDIHSMGLMEQWISVEAAYLSEPAVQLVKQLYWGPLQGLETDQALVERAKDRVEQALNVMEKGLTHQAYLAGDTFSLADISWMPYIDYLFPATLGHFISDRPAINRWWTEVSQRSTWLKVVNFKVESLNANSG